MQCDLHPEFSPLPIAAILCGWRRKRKLTCAKRGGAAAPNHRPVRLIGSYRSFPCVAPKPSEPGVPEIPLAEKCICPGNKAQSGFNGCEGPQPSRSITAHQRLDESWGRTSTLPFFHFTRHSLKPVLGVAIRRTGSPDPLQQSGQNCEFLPALPAQRPIFPICSRSFVEEISQGRFSDCQLRVRLEEIGSGFHPDQALSTRNSTKCRIHVRHNSGE